MAITGFANQPTQYRGLADLFPSLGAWIQGNREKVQAPFREKRLQKATSLLGTEGIDYQGEARPGGEQLRSQTEGTGLMADPESFIKQMKYGLGLMAIPGYEQAGRDFTSQAMASQLGMKDARQKQANWATNQARLLSETTDAKARADATEERQSRSAYATATSSLYKDYTKAAAPYRTTADLMTNVQQTVDTKGFTGLSLIDDVQLVKSYAKMLLPNEAVMTTDIQDLTKVDMTKNPELGIIRTFAAKLAGAVPLTETERMNLYDAMHRISGNSYRDYTNLRNTFEQRAARLDYNPDDIRRADMAPGNYPSLLPQQQKVLTETGGETGTIDYNDEANLVPLENGKKGKRDRWGRPLK